MEIEYKGLAYTKFFEVLDKKDGLSFCEKLYSLTRPETLKAPLPYASDKQFYEACERYLGFPTDEDAPLSDEEFLTWVNSK